MDAARAAKLPYNARPVKRPEHGMSSRTEGIILLTAMVALSAVFQVQVKLLAGQVGPVLARQDTGWLGLMSNILGLLMTWRVAFMGCLAVALLTLWLLTLSRLDLSFALPLASAAMAVTAIGGGLVLGENLSWARVAGVLLTAGGTWLILRT